MRDWMGQADMKWLNQSEHTQSWCETYSDHEPKFSPPKTQKAGCGDGSGG